MPAQLLDQLPALLDAAGVAASLLAIDMYVMPLPSAPRSQPLLAAGLPALAVGFRAMLRATFPGAWKKLDDVVPKQLPTTALVGFLGGAGAVAATALLASRDPKVLASPALIRDAAVYGAVSGAISYAAVTIVDAVVDASGLLD